MADSPDSGSDSADSPVDGSVSVLRDGTLLRLTLVRPDHRNSLSPPMTEALIDILTTEASDDALRAIHIQGSGEGLLRGRGLGRDQHQ